MDGQPHLQGPGPRSVYLNFIQLFHQLLTFLTRLAVNIAVNIIDI